MLAQALPQLERNIHPVVIIQAFKKALADALEIINEVAVDVDVSNDEQMHRIISSSIGTKFVSRWSGLMCGLALKAVRTVSLDVGADKKEVDIKRYARIEKIPGGEIEDSEVLDGVMVNKDITHPKIAGLHSGVQEGREPDEHRGQQRGGLEQDTADRGGAGQGHVRRHCCS
jgi:T-complex protein 1 subunit gamma